MGQHKVKILVQEMATMRDGAKLAADIYLPTTDGAWPTMFQRTPYGATVDHSALGIELARQGVAFVNMDCRGCFASEGDFNPWIAEIEDGEDSLKWLLAQPWCSGSVAMCGGSYLGAAQWMAAWGGDGALKAIAPHVAPGDLHDSPHYIGGAFGLGVSACWGLTRVRKELHPNLTYDWPALLRHRPLRDLDQAAGLDLKFWKDWIDHPSYDEFWERQDLNRRYASIKTPAFITGGWFDLYSKHNLESFVGMRAAGGSEAARRLTRCVIGPWTHGGGQGEMDFGCEPMASLEAARRKFLLGLLANPTADPLPEQPPLRYFLMGRNEWRGAETWPPPEAVPTDCFLHGGGSANTLDGDGTLSFTKPAPDEPADHFVYNPENPVPTSGGNNIGDPALLPAGPFDQRAVERRDDVLVYTSAALERDLVVAGPIKVVLHAASSAPDTDFTAKLVDVHPDGRAIGLCDGVIRARHRESFRSPKLMVPGEVYLFEIDCWVTANAFLAGHRIRLELSSSNFPRLDRNPNTGTPIGLETRHRVAAQTVFHDAARPSRLVLPVLPG